MSDWLKPLLAAFEPPNGFQSAAPMIAPHTTITTPNLKYASLLVRLSFRFIFPPSVRSKLFLKRERLQGPYERGPASSDVPCPRWERHRPYPPVVNNWRNASTLFARSARVTVVEGSNRGPGMT